MRVWIAGLLGGLAMFAWGAVSHMLLDLMGPAFAKMPNETAVVASMRSSISEPGLYMFPWVDTQDSAAMDEYQRRIATEPSGLLLYRPHTGVAMGARTFGIELASNVLVALVAAFLLSIVAQRLQSFASRWIFITLLGVLPPLSITVSHWNWDGFPRAWLVGEAIEQIGCFAVAGLVIAAMIKPVSAR